MPLRLLVNHLLLHISLLPLSNRLGKRVHQISLRLNQRLRPEAEPYPRLLAKASQPLCLRTVSKRAQRPSAPSRQYVPLR